MTATEIYTNGYDNPTMAFMRQRTLATHGQFIQPLLRAGQRLLDLGCGPGTMTLDLARAVAPNGSVVGVDQNGEQFPEVNPGSQTTFRAMSAYQLELDAGSFDGVFSHALFEHLAQPLDALTEAKRVLKEGGFIGLRSPDWGGFIPHPSDEPLRLALAARAKLQRRNGGNVHAGRFLSEWLRQAGFTDVKVTASYQIYPDNTVIIDHLASQVERAGQMQHAATFRKWAENPNAMFAQAWFEAIGYKRTKI